MTTIKLIATGTMLDCEKLKNDVRWLEIHAIRREMQKRAIRDFYDPGPARAAFNRKAFVSGPAEISIEHAVQQYKKEQEGVMDLVTATPDKKFNHVFTQDIKTRLSPYALMEKFNQPISRPTFVRMLNEKTVELYSTPDLAVARMGPETVIGIFDERYSWFDKRDAIKAHYP